MRARVLALTIALGCTPLFAAAAAAETAAEPGATERVQTREYDRKLKQVREAYEQKNWDRTFRLASETARWGHKYSQYVLGTLYLDGKGGAQENVLLAYGWMAAAAEADIEEFRDGAKRLRDAIPAAHHAEADATARAVIARYGMDATGVSCDRRRALGSNRIIVDCRKPHSLTEDWIEVPAWDESSLAQQRTD